MQILGKSPIRPSPPADKTRCYQHTTRGNGGICRSELPLGADERRVQLRTSHLEPRLPDALLGISMGGQVATILTQIRKQSRRSRRRAARSQQRLDIQGLRMVAVLTVFAFHLCGWPQGGFIGVDV